MFFQFSIVFFAWFAVFRSVGAVMSHVPWWGVLAPAGTPGAITAKLNGAMAGLLREADVRETFAREGIDRAGSSATEFGAYPRTEIAKWSKITKETGVQLDKETLISSNTCDSVNVVYA